MRTVRAFAVVLCLLATVACGEEPAATEEPVGTDEAVAPEPEAGAEATAAAAPECDLSGETLTIVVPFGPGGSADLLARLLAEEMPAHFPDGAPTITVENMPGGGGSIGMRDVLDRREPDGTSIIMTTSGMLMRWLLGVEGHDYPLQDMHPLGTFPTGLVTVAHQDRVSSFDDLLNAEQPIVWGAQSPSSSGGLFDQIASSLIDMNVEHVFGFEGEGATALAVERGEVAMATPTLAAYGGTYDAIESVAPVFQSGILEGEEISRSPRLPDVPTFAEEYERVQGETPSGPVWDAFLAFLQGQSLQQTTFLHPDTPAGCVELLGEAFRQTVEADTWEDATAEVLGEPQPGVGPDQTEELLAQFTSTPEEAVSTLQEISGTDA